MSVEPKISDPSTSPQARLWQRLGSATELSQAGKAREAANELETALTAVRETPYEIEFQSRIQLVMTLADLYYGLDKIPKACEMLNQEAAFAEKISQIMQVTGTPAQKRSATGGYLQIRDRATQMGLLGKVAPELKVAEWINGSAVSLSSLVGRVVLLEFWATWCKPCQEMFPKLVQLNEKEAANGLEIVAITRHYMAYQGTAEAKLEELQLMRRMIQQHNASFPVGVAADEKLQATYGANGLPTVFLIDRSGIVRYAGPGGDDPVFNKVLAESLRES